MTTVLICASADLEPDLCRTLFWREDLERYVTEGTDDARMLALATEPHIIVIDRDLPGSEHLVATLRERLVAHPISIVTLSHEAAAQPEGAVPGVDAVLSLPPGPEWDERLDRILQVPTRKQARYDVHFDVETLLRATPSAHRGLALNMSAGGMLIECPSLRLHPGDDVALSLPIPGAGSPVEGRARVVRQPNEERLGLRFEAFAGNGDAVVRNYLGVLSGRQAESR